MYTKQVESLLSETLGTRVFWISDFGFWNICICAMRYPGEYMNLVLRLNSFIFYIYIAHIAIFGATVF